MRLEAGGLYLWHGRVVEFLGVMPTTFAEVKFVDEGGVAWTYERVGQSELKPLAEGPHVTVLDALQVAAAPELTTHQTLERIAEVWFAAPEVGDVFERPGELRLKVMSSGLSGCIAIQASVYWAQRSSWGNSEVFFASPAQFRWTYRSEGRPGYQLRAHSTRRSDFAGHELLRWC